MNTHNKYISALAALFLMFGVAACSDDDNPIDPGPAEPNPVDTTRNDTIRIDSIDALTICPQNEVTLFGQNFPAEISQLSLQIGGQTAEVVSLSDSRLTTIVPWDIQSASIELFDAAQKRLAAFESSITPDCRTAKLPEMELEFGQGMLACVCEKYKFDIVLQELPTESFTVSLFAGELFIRDVNLPKTMTNTRVSGAFKVSREMMGNHIILKDENDIEISRSPEALMPDDFCRADFWANIAGLKVPVLLTTYNRFPETGIKDERNAVSVVSKIEVKKINPNTCAFGYHPDHSRYDEWEKQFYEQDTIVFESSSARIEGNAWFSPQYITNIKHQLRLIQPAGSDRPEYIELRLKYVHTSTYKETQLSRTKVKVSLRVNPAAISDDRIVLSGNELRDYVVCDFYEESWASGKDGSELVSTRGASGAIPIADSETVFNIQLGFK